MSLTGQPWTIVDPVGGAEQGMEVLREMNSLVDDHGEFVKSMGPTLDAV